MGRVYKRGNVWWIQYYRRSQLFRESSQSQLKSVALTLMKKREGDIADGRLPALQAEKTTFEDLVHLYLQDLEINRPRAVRRARIVTHHLTKAFGGLRANEITTQQISDYILKRRSEGVVNGTINKELKGLGRMFRLAARQTPPLVLSIPYIPHLREDNVRIGFFTREEYKALRGALPDHLKIPLMMGYWTGMRAGEILSLQWHQVNLQEGWLRKEPGTTKNGRGRTIPLAKEILDALERWKVDTLLHHPYCPWVCHFKGKQLKAIPRQSWQSACQRVGLTGKHFHDLRRTALRDMVRAGVPERIAMEISGHKTRAIFDRYNIVSEHDLFDAVTRLQAYRQSTQESTPHNSDLLDAVTRLQTYRENTPQSDVH